MLLFNIFQKEINYQLKSVLFWVFIAVVLLFSFSQFGYYTGNEKFSAPEPGQRSYGNTSVLTPEEEMNATAGELSMSLRSGRYYQIVFIINKELRLNEESRKSMEDLFSKIKNKELSYEEFHKEVNELNKLLGGNTIYGDKYRKALLNRPLTYEEAREEYFNRTQDYGLTNAYGRMFADYLGISAGFFPVFIAAFLLLRDKRTRMEELIRYRDVKPITYVGGKFLALAVLMGLIYLLLTIQPTIAFYKICSTHGWPFNPLGFVKYTALWVLPTLFFTIALGMVVSQITGSGLAAILVQLFVWFYGVSTLMGSYSLDRFIIRFNSIGNYSIYQKSINNIFINRLFYLAVTLVLVWICSIFWSKKNIAGRGLLNVFKGFSSTSEV